MVLWTRTEKLLQWLSSSTASHGRWDVSKQNAHFNAFPAPPYGLTNTLYQKGYASIAARAASENVPLFHVIMHKLFGKSKFKPPASFHILTHPSCHFMNCCRGCLRIFLHLFALLSLLALPPLQLAKGGVPLHKRLLPNCSLKPCMWLLLLYV